MCTCIFVYRKFPNKGTGRAGKPLLDRGHVHLPGAFYRMEISPFLAEIWPKTSRIPWSLVSKQRGALIGGGAPNGEFKVFTARNVIKYLLKEGITN